MKQQISVKFELKKLILRTQEQLQLYLKLLFFIILNGYY